MKSPLLATKLHAGTLKPGFVHRERLVDQLNEGLDRKLTLISAPAGFGKTALASDWTAGLRSLAGAESAGHGRVAWLSLDEDDNDEVRFVAYLIASLKSAIPKEAQGLGGPALDMLRPHEHPPVAEALVTLLNEVSAFPHKIVVVLDDYQFIQNEAIHAALRFLIEHQPPQMHLAIVTREDPPLPLPRLRAQGDMVEIRAGTLRFSSPEATQYLNGTMSLDLAAEDVAGIVATTEGWIAGLQMAAISIQEQGDASTLIKSFAGSHRYVMDYLLEEVLERQPESVQRFLLETAILRQLSGPLCDAVTGQSGGQSTLEMLEQANLFVVPLDTDRYWYRYHHLFRDLLELRLRQTEPERIPALHRQASGWYERNGFRDQAIEHALLAHTPELAERLIREQAEEAWRHGDLRIWRWIGQLPLQRVSSDPFLSMLRAFHLNMRGGANEEVERSLRDAERGIDALADGDADDASPASHQAGLRGRLAAMRCVVAGRQGDVRGITEQAEQALRHLPAEDLQWRACVALALGTAHAYVGDLRASHRARAEAARDCEATGLIYITVVANLSVAIAARDRGMLGQTLEICRKQIEIIQDHGLSRTKLAAWALSVLAEALVERNDSDPALAPAEAAEELLGQVQDVAALAWCFRCLMRVRLSTGDLGGAERIAALMSARASASTMPPWVLSQIGVWAARMQLARQDLEAAGRWMEERGLPGREPDGLGYFAFLEHLTAARILIAQGRFTESLELLSRLLPAAEASGHASGAVEIGVLQALGYQAGGEAIRALESLDRALAAAEPEGFVRVFVDEGPAMARLLHEAAGRGTSQAYARRLLAAFPTEAPPQTRSLVRPAAETGLLEPLSDRELEVLALIGEGLSNQDVGASLFISLHTVKAHTRNIYAKLGAHNRTEAVARGRAFGLLPLA